jgi:hypothetical protein
VIAVMFVCLPSAQIVASQATEDKNTVTVVRDDRKVATVIAENLIWSPKSKEQATKAIAFLKTEASNQIKILEKAGAVTVTRKYVSTSTSTFPDWNLFVPEYRQFVLIGKNKSGKTVSQSARIPKDSGTLESRLIQINADVCRIGAGSAANANLPSCSITAVDTTQFLRASLRTWMENYSAFEREEAGRFKELLETCLSNKYNYSIKNGRVSCPDNSKIWAENKEIPLSQNYSKFKYQIVLDSKRKTAVMTYTNRSLIDKAPEATNTYSSMLMFSY